MLGHYPKVDGLSQLRSADVFCIPMANNIHLLCPVLRTSWLREVFDFLTFNISASKIILKRLREDFNKYLHWLKKFNTQILL